MTRNRWYVVGRGWPSVPFFILTEEAPWQYGEMEGGEAQKKVA